MFAFGDLHYYGSASELNPSMKDGRHCGTCTEQQDCSYYRRWFGRGDSAVAKDDHLMAGQDIQAYSDYRPIRASLIAKLKLKTHTRPRFAIAAGLCSVIRLIFQCRTKVTV